MCKYSALLEVLIISSYNTTRPIIVSDFITFYVHSHELGGSHLSFQAFKTFRFPMLMMYNVHADIPCPMSTTGDFYVHFCTQVPQYKPIQHGIYWIWHYL